MKYRQKHFWFSTTAVVLVLLSVGSIALAESECSISPAIPLEVGIGTIASSTGLTQYVAEMYKFIVGSIGVLAAVMIMFNGMRWAASAGNAENITQAKEGISSAVIGLVIALMSYVLLYAVNAQLVNLVDICPEGLSFDSSVASSTGWSGCPSKSNSECSGVTYCQYTGGCECANVGTGDSGAYVCRPTGSGVIPEGTECKNTANCVTPLECLGNTTTNPGACTTATSGTTCTVDGDCTVAGMTCVNTDSTKQCLETTGRENGQYCRTESECASGVCNETAGVHECVSGDSTDTTTTCTDNDDCARSYTCESNRCTAKSGDGTDSCSSLNAECGTGLFCVEAGIFAIGTCYDGTFEDPCDDNPECDSGYCGKNECTYGSIDSYCDNDLDCTTENHCNYTGVNRCVAD